MAEAANGTGKGEGVQGGAGAPPEGTKPEGESAKAGAGNQPSEQKPAEKKEPAKASAKGSEQTPPAKKEEPKQISEDDDIPEDSELLSMSKQALAKRLDRHTKKELRERFGTDDHAQITKDLEELKTLRAEKEQKRRAELSENEKLKEDLAKEKKAREDAEKRAENQVIQQTFAEYDQVAKEVFGDKIAPKHVKRATRELKEHLLTLEEKEVPADPKKAKKVFEGWMKTWLEENPEFAKPAEEIKKIPLNTGANSNTKPEKGNANMAQKTAKPGQPNSMSKAEYNAYKRERGLS